MVSKGDIVFCDRIEEVQDAVESVVKDGDVVLTMGAGSIGKVALRLAGEG
jgi:UDP-N-acetylmuramate--alanine ligase